MMPRCFLVVPVQSGRLLRQWRGLRQEVRTTLLNRCNLCYCHSGFGAGVWVRRDVVERRWNTSDWGKPAKTTVRRVIDEWVVVTCWRWSGSRRHWIRSPVLVIVLLVSKASGVQVHGEVQVRTKWYMCFVPQSGSVYVRPCEIDMLKPRSDTRTDTCDIWNAFPNIWVCPPQRFQIKTWMMISCARDSSKDDVSPLLRRRSRKCC